MLSSILKSRILVATVSSKLKGCVSLWKFIAKNQNDHLLRADLFEDQKKYSFEDQKKKSEDSPSTFDSCCTISIQISKLMGDHATKIQTSSNKPAVLKYIFGMFLFGPCKSTRDFFSYKIRAVEIDLIKALIHKLWGYQLLQSMKQLPISYPQNQ